MGIADLHIHTVYSWDGTCTVPAILKYAREQVGLNVIAITDHDQIDGALEALALAPVFGIDIVPGIEISTADGHLLALYVQKLVPAGLSLLETVMRVGEAGGLCVAAHPLARGINSLSLEAITSVLQNPEGARVLVGIETFNAGIFHSGSNHLAEAYAHTQNVAHVGNSDSHVIFTIGRGATEFAGRTAADLRRALETGSTRVLKPQGVPKLDQILGWVPRYFMKRLGWATIAAGPEAPLHMGRFSLSLSSNQ